MRRNPESKRGLVAVLLMAMLALVSPSAGVASVRVECESGNKRGLASRVRKAGRRAWAKSKRVVTFAVALVATGPVVADVAAINAQTIAGIAVGVIGIAIVIEVINSTELQNAHPLLETVLDWVPVGLAVGMLVGAFAVAKSRRG